MSNLSIKTCSIGFSLVQLYSADWTCKCLYAILSFNMKLLSEKAKFNYYSNYKLSYAKCITKKHFPIHWRLTPSVWFHEMEPISIQLLSLQNLAKWYDLSSKQMILKHVSSVVSLFLKWYSNVLNTLLARPPPIPFPGLRICSVGKVTHGKAEPVRHSRVLFSCSATCLVQIYRKQPRYWQMSSPGTAMANTFQKPIHIFPLPYSLLAWSFSPVAASDGKHLLFYNKIIGYTLIISFPQKSFLGRSLVIYTLNRMCWKKRPPSHVVLHFLLFKKSQEETLGKSGAY